MACNITSMDFWVDTLNFCNFKLRRKDEKPQLLNPSIGWNWKPLACYIFKIEISKSHIYNIFFLNDINSVITWNFW